MSITLDTTALEKGVHSFHIQEDEKKSQDVHSSKNEHILLDIRALESAVEGYDLAATCLVDGQDIKTLRAHDWIVAKCNNNELPRQQKQKSVFRESTYFAMLSDYFKLYE